MLEILFSVRASVPLVVAILVLCLTRTHGSSVEQTPADVPDRAMYARIRDEGLSRSQVMGYATSRSRSARRR